MASSAIVAPRCRLRMERWLWPLSVGWRLLNAHSIRTYWLPDETWQSLEPAHYLAFGYGELTWEWQLGIRTAVYPYVLAAIYRMSAAILGNDSELLVSFFLPSPRCALRW